VGGERFEKKDSLVGKVRNGRKKKKELLLGGEKKSHIPDCPKKKGGGEGKKIQSK